LPPSCETSSGSMWILRRILSFSLFDEKSQIQALDRTQPGLPMKKGRCGTITYDYIRNADSNARRPGIPI